MAVGMFGLFEWICGRRKFAIDEKHDLFVDRCSYMSNWLALHELKGNMTR